MAYNENVQLEFSLDQKETYLASWLTKKAEEYTNLFRYKREAGIIRSEFGIENNVFNQEKYDELLESRGVVYAQRYKRYFILKKEILRIKDFLWFTKELGDEWVVVDEVIKQEDDDEITPPDVKEAGSEPEEPKEEPHQEDDIEALRQKYFEKFGKKVATWYKNNIEWIKKKLL